MKRCIKYRLHLIELLIHNVHCSLHRWGEKFSSVADSRNCFIYRKIFICGKLFPRSYHKELHTGKKLRVLLLRLHYLLLDEVERAGTKGLFWLILSSSKVRLSNDSHFANCNPIAHFPSRCAFTWLVTGEGGKVKRIKSL